MSKIGFVWVMACVGAMLSYTLAAAEETLTHGGEVRPVTKGISSDLEAKAVRVDTDGTHLTLVFDTGRDILTHLKQAPAGTIVQVYFDTDLDRSTGGKPFFAETSGYDVAIEDVAVCKGYEKPNSRASTCGGEMPGVAFNTFFSDHEPVRYDAARDDFVKIHGDFWKDGRMPFDGSKAVVKIPYATFGLKSGQTVRFLVVTGGINASKYADMKLVLK